MEREGNDYDLGGDKSLPVSSSLDDNDKNSILNSTLLLDHVGEVTLTFHSNGLSWKLMEPLENVCYFMSLLIAFNMFVQIPDLSCKIDNGSFLSLCWFACFLKANVSG